MTEEYRNIRERYSLLIKELREKINQLRQKETEELLKHLNFTEKYLHIESEESYLYVNEQFTHKDLYSDEPILVLRGQGFRYAFTPYEDYTFSNWDQFFSHTIKIENLDEELTHIKEITKEEYDKAFDSMIEKMIDEHNRYFKD